MVKEEKEKLRSFRWEELETHPGLTLTRDNFNRGMNSSLLVGSKLFWVGSIGRVATRVFSIGIFDLKEHTWQWVENTKTTDPYIHGSVCFLVDDGIFLHGGRDLFYYPNPELYRFDISLFEWNIVHVHDKYPSSRCYHAGEFIERIRKFVCLGGARTGEGFAFDAVWLLDVDRHVWGRPKMKGDGPKCNRGIATCVVGERIICFGGGLAFGKNTSNDLHLLHCADYECTWEKIVRHEAINLRFASLSYANGLLVLFGGIDREMTIRADVYVCQAPDFALQRVDTTSTRYSLENTGTARTGHSAVVVDGDVYILGGVNQGVSVECLRIP